jgi:hypothetical protein
VGDHLGVTKIGLGRTLTEALAPAAECFPGDTLGDGSPPGGTLLEDGEESSGKPSHGLLPAESLGRERISEPPVFSRLLGVQEVSLLTTAGVRSAGVNLRLAPVGLLVADEVTVGTTGERGDLSRLSVGAHSHRLRSPHQGQNAQATETLLEHEAHAVRVLSR